jgi:hypothetical protein
MFVIPPTNENNEYFEDIARTTWTTAERTQSNACEELQKGNRTLVISCKLDDTPDGLKIILHYRYYKGDLYCFIEEKD